MCHINNTATFVVNVGACPVSLVLNHVLICESLFLWDKQKEIFRLNLLNKEGLFENLIAQTSLCTTM
jgi:hypothetical protein